MIDAVLTYHTNPHTCGVARFNAQLARRLGVPCYGLPVGGARYPLVSIKASEIGPGWQAMLPLGPHLLLLHDRPADVPTALPVLYADTLALPPLIDGRADRGAVNVLLFGMAHKRQRAHLERLGDLLARQAQTWTVSVSQAIHEGSPWDTTWAETEATLQDLFGVHLRVLGYLADDALARELREATACALFFDPAARLNNTTLWAAMQARCPVITNLDADSPPALVHGHTCYDLARLEEWPVGLQRALVAREGHTLASAHTWDRLVEVLRAV